MATLLNEFFCSVFTEEAGGNLPAVEVLYKGVNPLVEVEFRASKIMKKITGAKEVSSTSTG